MKEYYPRSKDKIQLRFVVDGEPVAQPRSRAARFGDSIRMYTPQNHPVVNWKKRVELIARQTCRFDEINFIGTSTHPVAVDVEFVFERPRTVRRITKQSKPDIDNLLKSLFDGINQSGLWGDDALVVSVFATKRFTDNGELPQTVVTITQIETVESEKALRKTNSRRIKDCETLKAPKSPSKTK